MIKKIRKDQVVAVLLVSDEPDGDTKISTKVSLKPVKLKLAPLGGRTF